jgi:hypothetical protein
MKQFTNAGLLIEYLAWRDLTEKLTKNWSKCLADSFRVDFLDELIKRNVEVPDAFN